MLKSLRSKVFAFLSCLLLTSLVGVGISFVLTQRVNTRLSEINRRLVPSQRELMQLFSDTELIQREFDRSLGFSHWSEPRWKPMRMPAWVINVHRTTLGKIQAGEPIPVLWKEWRQRVFRLDEALSRDAEALFLALQEGQRDQASQTYPEWVRSAETLKKEVEWAKHQLDQETHAAFRDAQNQVQNLRFALQVLVLVVVGVALVVLWMGERALRPIGHLRAVVKQINERGHLTADERAGLPAISLQQRDEVSELAREFHQMATTLIEREKMIDFQKARLEEQNKALLQMGELQKRLQQAEHLAAVGRLSAQVAHEVGNPLHSIGLESELALEVLNRISPEKSASAISIKQALTTILTRVERLQKIIQNYLKLSRLSPGEKRKVDLQVCVENALATYANELHQAAVRVDWRFDPTLESAGVVYGDPDLLEYAIGNLIRNSLQALGREVSGERRIGIGLKAVGRGRAHFSFEDTGPGIEPEVRTHLFKPFFTTKAQGTGLGLSFVKKVFTDCGGDFRLVESAPGQGARFEGFFPLVPAGASVLPEAQA